MSLIVQALSKMGGASVHFFLNFISPSSYCF